MYEQKVVWFGTIVGDEKIKEFEQWFLDEHNYHVRYETEFELENDCFENKLNCVIFSICAKEIPQFSIWKIKCWGGEMRWWEDFLNDEMQSENVPSEILEKYPKQW